MRTRLLDRDLLAAVVAAVAWLAAAPAARAEHCWEYVDGGFAGFESTKAPFQCVQEGNFAAACSWFGTGSSCFADGNRSDCCTSIPPPPGTTQTVLAMHTAWHNCFGNVAPVQRNAGGMIISPPPGRGARWLAFHRQFEFDFDLFREATFGCNPMSGLGDGCFIENLDWHQGMLFPYGHFGAGLAPGAHAAGCGTGPNRPNDIVCTACTPLPACLYGPGGGPVNGDPPTPGCPGFPEFASATLNEIPTLDDVANILDNSHHGRFHGEVGEPFSGSCTTNADCAMHPGDPVCSGGSCVYNTDVLNPSCSPRDPMFWRLHKRLDDTVRAWQSFRPVDVTVVIDRSGSMSETDASGRTKISVATEAMELMADLLQNGSGSRLGVVSYATSASTDLALTAAASAPASVAPVAASIAGSVGGCTGIGAGLEAATVQLCNGTSTRPASLGKESCHPADGHLAGAGEAQRKGIVLLTDGLENRAPCLRSSGGATASCGSVCGGGQFDFDLLGPHTQLCAVGFGQAGSLNGNLLTLVAERQGGIYMQSPAKGPDDVDGMSGAGSFVDLKDFFVKCLGQISDEFVGLDPKGTLPAAQRATDPMSYSTCTDARLTFVGGWNRSDDLRLLVNTPDGDLVRGSMAGIEASNRPTWSFLRVPLPFQGESGGAWRAQIVRPHYQYVNGFTTDSLPAAVGTALVRRQIQRLCPDGCANVLYFEDGRLGAASSYEAAIAAEVASGLLGTVTVASSPADLHAKLAATPVFNLLVYAHQMTDQPEPYDQTLVRRLCSFQPAIVTDTRTDAGSQNAASLINRCAGATLTGADNWSTLFGDGRLIEGSHALGNPGYARASYGLQVANTFDSEAQAAAAAASGADAAIVASGPTVFEGPVARDQSWFMDVLVAGGARLDDAPMRATVQTSEAGLLASVRVLPAHIPRGGFEASTVRVEVEHPLTGRGIGQTLIDIGRQPPGPGSPTADGADGRAAAFARSRPIPTGRQSFVLNDLGQAGDLHAGNGQWSVQIPTLGRVDGMYRLHFTADFVKNGCTTRREITRSVFVDVGVDAGSSGVQVTPVPGGATVDICPRDRFGNPSGWGRQPVCGPAPGCTCAPSDIVDHGNGCYTIRVHTSGSNPKCTVDGFGAPVDLPLAPEITAPPQRFSRCVPAPAEETLDVTVTGGTLTGRLVSVNGVPLPAPVPVNPQTRRVILPIGTSVVEWTATSAGGLVTHAEQPITVTPGSGRGCCGAGQLVLEGDDQANSITPAAERAYCVLARGGGDFVQTRAANDFVFGEDGGDNLDGGGGADLVNGGPGGDAITGGANAALRAYGGPGADALNGSRTRTAELRGGPGADLLVGGNGNDFLAPGGDPDFVVAGAGNDTVVLHHRCEIAASLFLDGGLGTDTLVTPIPVHELRARGVIVASFERVIVDRNQGHLAECFAP